MTINIGRIFDLVGRQNNWHSCVIDIYINYQILSIILRKFNSIYKINQNN